TVSAMAKTFEIKPPDKPPIRPPVGIGYQWLETVRPSSQKTIFVMKCSCLNGGHRSLSVTDEAALVVAPLRANAVRQPGDHKGRPYSRQIRNLACRRVVAARHRNRSTRRCSARKRLQSAER